jgi:hypothetical protein
MTEVAIQLSPKTIPVPSRIVKNLFIKGLHWQVLSGMGMSVPWREKTAATKIVALHPRRESTPTLYLPQVQQECDHPGRGRLRAVRGYPDRCLCHDRGRHGLVRERPKRRPYQYDFEIDPYKFTETQIFSANSHGCGINLSGPIGVMALLNGAKVQRRAGKNGFFRT